MSWPLDLLNIYINIYIYTHTYIYTHLSLSVFFLCVDDSLTNMALKHKSSDMTLRGRFQKMQAQMYVLDNYGHLSTVVCTQCLVVLWCTVCWLLLLTSTAQVLQREIPNGQISETDVWWVTGELLMMESLLTSSRLYPDSPSLFNAVFYRFALPFSQHRKENFVLYPLSFMVYVNQPCLCDFWNLRRFTCILVGNHSRLHFLNPVLPWHPVMFWGLKWYFI